jgi:hypothetical protein
MLSNINILVVAVPSMTPSLNDCFIALRCRVSKLRFRGERSESVMPSSSFVFGNACHTACSRTFPPRSTALRRFRADLRALCRAYLYATQGLLDFQSLPARATAKPRFTAAAESSVRVIVPSIFSCLAPFQYFDRRGAQAPPDRLGLLPCVSLNTGHLLSSSFPLNAPPPVEKAQHSAVYESVFRQFLRVRYLRRTCFHSSQPSRHPVEYRKQSYEHRAIAPF